MLAKGNSKIQFKNLFVRQNDFTTTRGLYWDYHKPQLPKGVHFFFPSQ